MITYQNSLKDIQVKLDGKVVGRIIRKKGQGYAYQPKGTKISGEIHSTVDEVKKSIEWN